jgi:hypothetical protein
MEASTIALFLQKIHLFHELTDDQLIEIAEKITEVSVEKDEVILEQGDEGNEFYLIYSGKVRMFRQFGGQVHDLATLVSGDYFGETELFTGQGNLATVTATEATRLLRLSKEDFDEILKAYPSIKFTLDLAVASRKLAQSTRFKWLGPDEVVYFLQRKGTYFLLEVLVIPVMALLVPAALFFWGVMAQSTAAITFGVIALLGVLGWIAWRYIDWANDYYVVTNQRVVWLEKVIGLYDSRTEAPLSEILSVGVETDIIGRALGHGTVIVRTFVGAIPFKHVRYPYQAAHMVEEYWHRTQKASEEAEKEAFKEALRQRLGLLHPPQEEDTPPEEVESKQAKQPNFLKLFIANLFSQRIVEGDRVTYRKHWYVLLKHVFLPSAIFLALFSLTIRRLFILVSNPDLSLIQNLSDGTRRPDTLIILLPLFMLLALGWWVYNFIDWQNDIFRVTSDQIFDIDKKPLGSEQSRAAPLDNILGTRYERVGFLGYILNFGTVYIDVGSAHFAFEDVLDPAAVQTDIDRRRLRRISSKKASEQATERKRMADWIAAYHQNIEEFREEQTFRDTNAKTE